MYRRDAEAVVMPMRKHIFEGNLLQPSQVPVFHRRWSELAGVRKHVLG